MRTQFIILTLLVAISGVISKGKKPKPKPYNWLVLTGGKISSDSYVSSSEIVGYIGGCPEPTSIPALPADVEIANGQSVWSEKRLVFCGGSQTGSEARDQCSSIDKPDGAEAEWADFPKLTSARALFSMTIMNNKPTDQLLAVGGRGDDGTCLNTMERYTFPRGPSFPFPEVQGAWKALPYKIPVPTCGHCAVRLGLKTVMIIGGAPEMSSIVPTNKVWKINLNRPEKTKKMVTPLQVLPVGLWRPACVRRGGKVYVSGGMVLGGASLADVYEYDIKDNTWSMVGALHTGRYGHVMGNTAENQMVVAGGYNNTGGLLSSIEDNYDNGATWFERSWFQSLGDQREYSAMAEVPAFTFNCYTKNP